MFSVFRKIPKNPLKNRYFSHFYFAGAGRPAPVKTQYSRQKRNTNFCKFTPIFHKNYGNSLKLIQKTKKTIVIHYK